MNGQKMQEINSPIFDIEEVDKSYTPKDSVMVAKEIPLMETKYSVKVIAKWISNKIVAFECPFCWTRYSVNGEPYKKAKSIIHCYETKSNNIYTNFRIYQIPYCQNRHPRYEGNLSKWKFPHEKCSLFAIYVTDETQRKIFFGEKKRIFG